MFELISELFAFIIEIAVFAFSILSSTIEFIFGSISTLHTEMPRVEGALVAILTMWIVSNKDKYSILRKMFIPIDLAITIVRPYLDVVTSTMRIPAAWVAAAPSRLSSAASTLLSTLWNKIVSKLK